MKVGAFETISEHRCHGGVQGFYRHGSQSIGLPMRLAVYRPPAAAQGRVPVLFYLSGLTCTEENFTIKAGAQRLAAEHGLMLVVPDTSPRESGIEGEDEDWAFGTGAGFYLDATLAPWSRHYRMESYVAKELPALVREAFPADGRRMGVFGHSMGGHGAISLALNHPGLFRSVSALAPMNALMDCSLGRAALARYLWTTARPGAATTWPISSAAAIAARRCWWTRAAKTSSCPNCCPKRCGRPAWRRASRSPSTCARATTTATGSCRASWPATSPTTPPPWPPEALAARTC